MITSIWTHPSCVKHDPGPGHPEQPARLVSVLNALPPHLARFEAPRAAEEDILRVHTSDYLAALKRAFAVAADRPVALDPDTHLNEASEEAAWRAAGAGIAAVDAVMKGETKNAFCAVRPPGHHAEASHAMGFCLFNNVAVAAKYALEKHGFSRVAIVDFDVHHGNGTQHTAEEDPRILYASTHQYPFYPGTGAEGETGSGNVVNAPLEALSGGKDFRRAYEAVILPALEEFAPEFLFISAGFDAHHADPLAQLQLKEDDFAWVTQRLMQLADKSAKGRIVSFLEGGYNLTALGQCARAHVETLAA
jgi:acetoin utilization deacetylase AcuC-like enzyme